MHLIPPFPATLPAGVLKLPPLHSLSGIGSTGARQPWGTGSPTCGGPVGQQMAGSAAGAAPVLTARLLPGKISGSDGDSTCSAPASQHPDTQSFILWLLPVERSVGFVCSEGFRIKPEGLFQCICFPVLYAQMSSLG